MTQASCDDKREIRVGRRLALFLIIPWAIGSARLYQVDASLSAFLTLTSFVFTVTAAVAVGMGGILANNDEGIRLAQTLVTMLMPAGVLLVASLEPAADKCFLADLKCSRMVVPFWYTIGALTFALILCVWDRYAMQIRKIIAAILQCMRRC